MSARAASSALILSLLIAPGLFRPAQAGAWLPAPGEYCTELRGGLFSADTYRNDAGDRVSLGGKWEERSLLSTVELGWKKRLSFVLSAPVMSVTRQDAFGSQTSTGLKDLTIGLRRSLHQGNSALALEFDWKTPLGYGQRDLPADPVTGTPGRPRSLFSDPFYGSGFQQLSASLLVGTPLGKRGFLQMAAGSGYRFLSVSPKDSTWTGENVWVALPLDDGSFLLEYRPVMKRSYAAEAHSIPFLASADLGWWVTRTLLVGGRYSGMTTIAHGDSVLAQSIHLMGPYVLLRVDDRLDLVAGSWSTAMAKEALHFDQVYVAVTFKQTKLNRLQGFLGGTKAP
jgi:hypothetical protein